MNGRRVLLMAAVAVMLTACAVPASPDQLRIPEGMYWSVPSNNDRRIWGWDEVGGVRYFNTTHNSAGGVVEERLDEETLLAIESDWYLGSMRSAESPTSTSAVAVARAATPTLIRTASAPEAAGGVESSAVLIGGIVLLLGIFILKKFGVDVLGVLVLVGAVVAIFAMKTIHPLVLAGIVLIALYGIVRGR